MKPIDKKYRNLFLDPLWQVILLQNRSLDADESIVEQGYNLHWSPTDPMTYQWRGHGIPASWTRDPDQTT